jgi:hypothetical protein
MQCATKQTSRKGVAHQKAMRAVVKPKKTVATVANEAHETQSVRGRRLAHELEGGAAGALAGAIVGVAAGPPGAVVGAIVGAAAGTVTGAALDTDEAIRNQRTRELDAAIGVTEGSLGAPNLAHPPAERGVYSAASSGAGAPSGAPAEGAMQVPEGRRRTRQSP